jgi:hypothetical protein
VIHPESPMFSFYFLSCCKKLRFPNFLWIVIFLLPLGLGVIFTPIPSGWAAESLREQTQTYLLEGIRKGFNLQEKEGLADLSRAIAVDRENPLGYAYLSVFSLFYYEMRFDEKERQKDEETMLLFIEQAIAKGEKRIENNSRDGDAHFSIALAKLVKARFDIRRKSYLAAAQESGKIWDLLEKAEEFEPKNYDIYFLMGIMHYHVDHLTGLARFFSSFFFMRGDKKKGLQELELAAAKGNLLQDLAKAELASAYANFEKDPKRALPLAKELREKFPRNYNFLFLLANILSDLNQTDEALGVAQEIEEGIKLGKPPFRPELRARTHQLLGKIYFDRKEYGKASEFLLRAIQDEAPYNIRMRAWALLRLGMIHDVRKERKQAEDFYRRVLDMDGVEGSSQVLAKQYLKTAYSPP